MLLLMPHRKQSPSARRAIGCQSEIKEKSPTRLCLASVSLVVLTHSLGWGESSSGPWKRQEESRSVESTGLGAT
jgi:hypothetical protein